MEQLKILHGAYIVGKSSFGIGQISISLAKAQQAFDNEVKIWCLDTAENIKWAADNHGFPEKDITGYKLFGPQPLWFSPQLQRASVANANGNFDIVHQHGIWTGISRATLKFSQKKITPTIIAPHGSLNQWALSLSKLKKKIALSVYERENLRLASCLHATSEYEIADFRNFGLKNPIAYISNGIQDKYLTSNGDASRFFKQYDLSPDKRIILFLARITPIKGLPMLIDAIHANRDQFSAWQLVIAGIDEFDHKKEVAAKIKELNLDETIKFIGPLFGDVKSDAFAAAELFVLPSHAEGSPMVVLDSLAAGVPVITTKASSWNDLIEYGCGWWTEIDTDGLSEALKKAISLSADDLKKMGENGRQLIANKYTWQKLAQETILLYNWLLGRGDMPSFVVLY